MSKLVSTPKGMILRDIVVHFFRIMTGFYSNTIFREIYPLSRSCLTFARA